MAKKGQILTNAERLKISQRTREGMQRPEVKQRLEESWTPERRKVVSEFHKEDSHRPERIAISMANLPAPMPKEANPSWRGGHYKECAFCGKDFWVNPYREGTAKYCSKECKDKALDIRGEANPNWRGGHYKRCEYCGNQFWVIPATERKRHYCSQSCKAKAEGTFRRLNNDPNFQQKRLQAAIKQPNRQEEKLKALLDTWFPNEWKFVGDGEVILGRLNPDFINCNGKKMIIELFGCWYHGCPIHHPNKKVNWQDTETGKRVIYSRYGFKTLVIWEHELEDEKAVMDKIVQFTA